MTRKRIQEARIQIVEIGSLMLDRNLTDLAGGNISIRVGNNICMSPRYAGSRYHWRLRPEQILVLDLEGNKQEGEGIISREIKVHIKVLNTFPEAGAVVHAHARNVMVFCATQQSVPPVLEGTLKFGEIKVIPYAPGGVLSEELAENVIEGFRGQENRIRYHAAAVIAPWHGMFAAGKDIYSTIDAVERIEVNARCILLGKVLTMDNDRLNKHREALSLSSNALDTIGDTKTHSLDSLDTC